MEMVRVFKGLWGGFFGTHSVGRIWGRKAGLMDNLDTGIKQEKIGSQIIVLVLISLIGGCYPFTDVSVAVC